MRKKILNKGSTLSVMNMLFILFVVICLRILLIVLYFVFEATSFYINHIVALMFNLIFLNFIFNRLKKFGVFTLFILFNLQFLVFVYNFNFIWSLFGIAGGLLADYLSKKGDYQNKVNDSLAFAFTFFGVELGKFISMTFFTSNSLQMNLMRLRDAESSYFVCDFMYYYTGFVGIFNLFSVFAICILFCYFKQIKSEI